MVSAALSIGKFRGLEATSTPGGIFTILALDHRQALMKMINPNAPYAVTYDQVVKVKSAFVGGLGKQVSAVLLDPIYGVSQTIANGSLPGSTGLMMAVEQSGYTGTTTARISQIQPGWSVAKAKRSGANAIKLLVYYHPEAGESTRKQERLIEEVVEDCKQADLPLFLEVMTFSPDDRYDRESKEFAVTLPEVIRTISERLGGMGADILKLEFPVNFHYDMDEEHWYKACVAITDSSPCPWTLLSAGINFELFCRQVEVACRAGASGFIAGRAVWKDGLNLPGNQLKSWLDTTAADRIATLCKIAEQYGKPWQSFFRHKNAAELRDWYLGYEG